MNSRWQSDRLLITLSLFVLAFGLAYFMTAGAASAAADRPDESSYGSGDATHQGYDDGWEYDPYYVFPLTRHMSDSELPMAGQIALYPFAFVIDVVQLPIGALAGLAGK